MHFTQVLVFASSAALVAAAPAPAPAPIMVRVDDVILFGKGGRFTIMKRSQVDELEKLRSSRIPPPMPSHLDNTLVALPIHQSFKSDESEESNSTLRKRATSIVIPGPESRFLGWDVQTSQIVKGAPTTVSINTGYTVGNSINVSQGATLTLIKDFLTATTTVDYGRSWTSSQSQLVSGEVPEGKYGAWVTNAWTNRKTGNVWEGTIGGEGSLTYYQADSFESKSYDNFEWVDGLMSLCMGDELPLKRCAGEGTF